MTKRKLLVEFLVKNKLCFFFSMKSGKKKMMEEMFANCSKERMHQKMTERSAEFQGLCLVQIELF